MSRAARREAVGGYLFLLPWVLGFLLLIAGPMLASLYLSLTNYGLARPPVFVSNRPILIGVAALLALAFMPPFFWVIATSLKQVKELYQFPPAFVPEVAQWNNYAVVWTRVSIAKCVLNTFIIAGISMLGTLLTASLVADSFALYRNPGLLYFCTQRYFVQGVVTSGIKG